MGYIQWMPQTRPLPVLWERPHSDLESLPQWWPSGQSKEVKEGLGMCACICVTSGVVLWVQYVCVSVCFYVFICVCVCLSEYSFSLLVPCQITVVFRGRLLQGVSGLLILAWGKLWWRSLVLMSGLADAARRAGTSLARLPPLMSSLLSIVLFHPCFPQAIQPAQTILFSFSGVSIILLNLLLSRAQAWVFAGLLFQLTQGLVVNIDWG